MDCDKSNIASAKSIMNNSGILENEVMIDGELNQRYWISLKKRYANRYEFQKILFIKSNLLIVTNLQEMFAITNSNP